MSAPKEDTMTTADRHHLLTQSMADPAVGRALDRIDALEAALSALWLAFDYRRAADRAAARAKARAVLGASTPERTRPWAPDFDRALWTRLLGGASPTATVTIWTTSRGTPAAEAVAAEIWDAHAGQAEWRTLDRDATVASLARVLRHDGGAL